MSGGSMNYLYQHIENDAVFRTDTPERAAFAAHLDKVTKALHDIEWVDSCDYGRGDEVAAIMACITPTDMLDQAIRRAEDAQSSLTEVLRWAKGEQQR